MPNPSAKRRTRWMRWLVLAGTVLGLWLWRKNANRKPRFPRLRRWYLDVTEQFNLAVPWYRLPLPLALVNFIGMRMLLRARNLHDTQSLPAVDPDVDRPADLRSLRARTADGTYNDLAVPQMGSAGARFGRNFPLENVFPDESRLLTPNPRTVSRELLTRQTFQPATTLNLLAAAWLQFMVHDWLSHGKNDKDRMVEIPLADDDPWSQRPMLVARTRTDPAPTPDDAGRPPAYVNTETHWWDGSQIYGSNQAVQDQVRAFADGKLRVTADNLLPVDPVTGIDITGVTGNWWLGLSLLHTLFTLEHNAICDRLKRAYPKWSDEALFDTARLINVALMAKIHTVEWTPGILGTPALRLAMRGNWWGLAGEQLYRRAGRISQSEVISGILGSSPDHHGALYALTEEFTAVYRMHPLIPDDYVFRAAADGRTLHACTFREVAGRSARQRLDEIPMLDAIYSFGVSHPGAITLHNFPKFLQTLVKQDGDRTVDLAAVDLLRDRERGVPRYNQFRQLLHKPPARSFEEITGDPRTADQLRRVYDGKVEDVDLMIGLYAEPKPPGFGFSDTAFRLFILMASRRLKSDRFFTVDFTPGVYTPEGMAWIDDNTMSTVLLRHFPALERYLSKVDNALRHGGSLRQERRFNAETQRRRRGRGVKKNLFFLFLLCDLCAPSAPLR